LALRCEQGGVKMLYSHNIERLNVVGGAIESVAISPVSKRGESLIHADSVVVACGSYSAPLLRSVGVDLPVYPGKGYSVTLPLLRPDDAPLVSTIDDEKKIAMTRLGNFLRVAGTIEVGGYDTRLDTPLAQKRCEMLLKRIETLLPGVADTRTPAQGGNPQYWTGLRPATPSNIPYIGRTKVSQLWVNTGHGTLGWTHGAGSGKAIAELMSGRRPQLAFGFLGDRVGA
jgi:D-amino-acid dehydrogenase